MSDLDAFIARYTDGRSALEQRLTVRISAKGLAFEADGCALLWSASGLSLVDRVNGHPRLAHTDFPEARLLFGPEAEAALNGALPKVMRAARNSLRVDLRRFAGFGLAAMALVALIYFSLPSLSAAITALIPISYERDLGEQTLGNIDLLFDGAAQNCTGAPGQAALHAMLDRLLSQRNPRIPVSVSVAPLALRNALALPGGRILIFDGLIRQARSPEEVAGVLAHEIGHTQLRHGMQRLLHGHALSLLIGIVAPGNTAGLAKDLSALLAFQSYSREAEAEADDYAITLLNEADIRSDGLAGFFESAAGENDDGGADRQALQYFSSHPQLLERARRIRALGRGKNSILSEAEWQALRAICADDGGDIGEDDKNNRA